MNPHTTEWLAQETAKQFGYVLEAMTAQQYSATASAAALAEFADLLWWDYQLSGAISGRAYVGASKQAADALGGAILNAAGVEPDPETARSTFFELATQVLSGLTQVLSAKIGRPVDCSAGGSANPEASAALATIHVSGPDGAAAVAYISFSSDLLDELQPREKPRPAAEEGAAATLPTRAEAPGAVLQKGPLDMLLDVELPVSISFGRAQLQIKDVMKLASGSIVELNRHVSEPVEVLVNNCVIARGEVVVVEGNYGIRIQQIISPQDRLRTLR